MTQTQTQTQNQAFIPQILARHGNLVSHNILTVAVGVVFISLLAQVAIPLPFTPVPVTGQTFGVALTSLLWGRARGVATMMTYLSVGWFGLPIFALGKSGFSLGPSSGYLFGMLIASYWMGYLADSGWTKTFFRTWLSAFSGSMVVFAFGLTGLSFFLPFHQLLSAGLFPFIPGDFIKTLLVSFVASQSTHLLEVKK